MAKIEEQKASNSSNDKPTKENEVNIGALLIEARSNLKLTEDDIAKQLNLSKAIIHNLENNQFTGSLPLTFIRGYLISYAMKVGLDAKHIEQSFDNQMGSESISLRRVESLSVFEKNRKDFNSNSLIFKAVTFLIIVIVLFFSGKFAWEKYQTINFQNEGNSNSNDQNIALDANEITLDVGSSSTQNQNLIAEGELIDSDLANDVTQENINNSAQEEQQKELNLTESNESTSSFDNFDSSLELNPRDDSTPKANLTRNMVTELAQRNSENFRLSFSDECWVKITDALGNELAVGIKKAGKLMNLSGVPPIEVILGDPAAATLHFKDEVVSLSQYRAKRRARIILK